MAEKKSTTIYAKFLKSTEVSSSKGTVSFDENGHAEVSPELAEHMCACSPNDFSTKPVERTTPSTSVTNQKAAGGKGLRAASAVKRSRSKASAKKATRRTKKQ